MSRNIGPSCKKCRVSGVRLFLKGDRCHTAKCAIEKRNFPPGIRDKRMRKVSEYGRRLREKQKLRFFYGVTEGQMRSNFKEAVRRRGITGHNMLSQFEKRLDSLVFRARMAGSRAEARQFVLHGHFLVNGKKANIPSMSIRPGDEIQLRDTAAKFIVDKFEATKEKGFPAFISVDESNRYIKLLHEPAREEIDVPVEEQLIVEFYSR